MHKLRLTEGNYPVEKDNNYGICYEHLHSFVVHSASVIRANIERSHSANGRQTVGFSCSVRCDMTAKIEDVHVDTPHSCAPELADVPVYISSFKLYPVELTSDNEKQLFTPAGYRRITSLEFNSNPNHYRSVNDVKLSDLSALVLRRHVKSEDINANYLIGLLEEELSTIYYEYTNEQDLGNKGFTGTVFDPCRDYYGNNYRFGCNMKIADDRIMDIIEDTINDYSDVESYDLSND